MGHKSVIFAYITFYSMHITNYNYIKYEPYFMNQDSEVLNERG